MNAFYKSLPGLVLLMMMACSNPTNKRAVSLDELESIQDQDKSTLEELAPLRERLSAIELIELADCRSISCVQLYMKNLSRDFINATKGEFSALQHITIKDTADNELTLPASTYYIDVNPQATWKAIHTVHTMALADSLLNEFKALGFQLIDNSDVSGNKQFYTSEKYPGRELIVKATFHPWYLKGLYANKVTWVCYVFEIHNDEEN